MKCINPPNTVDGECASLQEIEDYLENNMVMWSVRKQ